MKKNSSEAQRSISDKYSTKNRNTYSCPLAALILSGTCSYNDGYVLPAAINKYICFAISRNNSSSCVLHACDMQDTYQFSLDEPVKPVGKSWVNYILGVVSQLQEKASNLRGVNVVFSSTIPMEPGSPHPPRWNVVTVTRWTASSTWDYQRKHRQDRSKIRTQLCWRELRHHGPVRFRIRKEK